MKVTFNDALYRFGDMMNAEVKGLGIPAETALSRIIEMGPQGAAIRGGYTSKEPDYKMDWVGIEVAKWVALLSEKSRLAILARYVMWDIKSDKGRAEACNCSEEGYRKRLTRARKQLKRDFKAWKHKNYLRNVQFKPTIVLAL